MTTRPAFEVKDNASARGEWYGKWVGRDARDSKAEDAGLRTRFLRGVLHDLYEFQTGNFDYTRHEVPLWTRVARQFKDKVLAIIRDAGFVRRLYSDMVADRLETVLDGLDRYESTYTLLGDEYSRNLLTEILKFRVLGNRYVRLPSNTSDYWSKARSVDRKYLKAKRTVRTWRWYLNRYAMGPAFGSAELDCHKLNVLDTFLLEQYRYGRSPAIEAEPGDVVIDGGGCWGDTALYFAHKVGDAGRVVCFEFLPSNLKILQANLERNPALESRIEVVERALWSTSGDEIRYSDNGPATTLGKSGTECVVSTTVDDLFTVGRLDLLKLDVEGAELDTLRGAEATLRRCRPKLAVSVYHRWDDIVRIPEYLHGLGLDYEFFLDHFAIQNVETVLFARPRSGRSGREAP